MSDKRLRDLERAASGGDPDAMTQLSRERERYGIPEPTIDNSLDPPRIDSQGRVRKAAGDRWLAAHQMECMGGRHCPACDFATQESHRRADQRGLEFDRQANLNKKPGMMSRMKKFFSREDFTAPQLKLLNEASRICSLCGYTEEDHYNPDGTSRVRHGFKPTSPDSRPKPEPIKKPGTCTMCGNTKEWHIYPKGHPKAGYSRVRHMFTPSK